MYKKWFQLTPQLRSFTVFSNNSILRGKNYENYVSKRWAGHSKWQNIKATKSAMDNAKCIAFNRISKLIELAVRDGGEDIALNPKLRTVWEEAQKINMPKATFENRLKALKNKIDKPYWTVFSGPKGIVLGFEVLFANKNPSFLQQKLALARKLKLKMEVHFQNFCTEKGIIIAEPLPDIENSHDQAIEHAIEIGVDEVFENEDKCLIFECLPDSVYVLQEKLEKKGYEILSASRELDFKEFIMLENEEIENLENLVNKLKGLHPEILRSSDNVIKS